VRAGQPSLRVGAKQGLDERGRLERREVVLALAETDQLDRDAEFALDSDDDAALRRAVELRSAPRR
jgi:hypothetical protein